MPLRLIQRTILLDLVKTTLLALFGVSALLMMVGAMVEAARRGIDPLQILALTPYLIPPTLPYTLPTCLLFACTVVFGSMSSNNEVTALKAAGIHVFRVIGPAVLLGIGLAALGVYITDRFIPASNQRFAEMVLADLESNLHAYLRQKGSIVEPGCPYELYVQTVRDDRLIGPIIKHRTPAGTYEWVVQASEATMRVVRASADAPPKIVLRLIDGVATNDLQNALHFRDRTQEMPLPASLVDAAEEKSENLTFRGLARQSRRNAAQAFALDEKTAAAAVDALLAGDPLAFAAGIDRAQIQSKRYYRKERESLAEVHLRVAQSVAAVPFVLLGCPVSLLLRRRDFLHTFFLCFLPIVTMYYPAMILAFNVFKEGQGSLLPTLWGPTAAMFVVAVPLLRRVVRY